MGRRLLDGVDPALTERAQHAFEHVEGVEDVHDVRLRWSGHRLNAQATLTLDRTATLIAADTIRIRASEELRQALHSLGHVDLTVRAASTHPGPRAVDQ